MEPTNSQRVIAGVASRLKARLGPERFARYFAAPGSLRIESNRLDVRVANQMLAGVYDRQFRQLLLGAMREETGRADWSVRFIVDPAAAGAATVNERATAAAAAGATARAAAPVSKRRTEAVRYDLEGFVVGACNHVAHKAAVCLVDAPDVLSSGSPLLLIGPCGMGKTHLLQAAARAGAAKLGATAAKYVSAESFSHEFSHAVRGNKSESFRKAYRHLELLCIDDIDALSTKPKTQIELQHVIDAIRHRGGRVAAAAREHPKRIPGLTEALVSRLCAGMTAKLDYPDALVLRKMLRTLAQQRGLLIEDAALEALSQSALRPASHGGGASGPGAHACSVRELEGLLTKVQAVHAVLSQLSGEPADPTRPIGALSVRAALDRGTAGSEVRASGPLLSPTTGKVVPRPVRIASVIQLVCARLGVSEADLRGRSRQERLVLARTLTAYLGKRLTTMSYPEIARAMGRPNHSTIITACQRMARQIEEGATVAAIPGSPHEPLGALCERLAEQLMSEARGVA